MLVRRKLESDIHKIVGHGHSEGERVHVEDVDTYVQDVIHHVELMKNKYPHLPCILIGHSMVKYAALYNAYGNGGIGSILCRYDSDNSE